MEYRIEYWDRADELMAAVARRIAEGWRPLGGVSVCHLDRTAATTWAQALVREDSGERGLRPLPDRQPIR